MSETPKAKAETQSPQARLIQMATADWILDVGLCQEKPNGIKIKSGSGAQGRTAPIKKNQSLTSEWDSKFFQEFLRLFADTVPPEPLCQFSDQRGDVGQCNVLRNWQGSVFVIGRQ
jgi:hypothetical protein